jgi:hypothetical protein
MAKLSLRKARGSNDGRLTNLVEEIGILADLRHIDTSPFNFVLDC